MSQLTRWVAGLAWVGDNRLLGCRGMLPFESLLSLSVYKHYDLSISQVLG